jgi:hypothetical protein
MQTNFKSDPVPAPISAAGLLQALDVILETSPKNDNATISSSILGPQSNFFGRIVAAQMYRLTSMATAYSGVESKGVNAIQALLANVLYYGQPGSLAGTVLPFTGSSMPATSSAPFYASMPSTDFKLAVARYQLNVSRPTLLAYAILGGVTLSICISALVFTTFGDILEGGAETTLFPVLDFWTNCVVVDQQDWIVGWDRMDWIRKSKARKLFEALGPLKIVYREDPRDVGRSTLRRRQRRSSVKLKGSGGNLHQGDVMQWDSSRELTAITASRDGTSKDGWTEPKHHASGTIE